MRPRGETLRFWVPIALLAAFAAYSVQKLVIAHVDPDVKSVNYVFERCQEAPRGSVFDCNGMPLARSVPVWNYHFDPVAMTNRVVRRRGEPPRPPAAIAKTIANALKIDFKKVLAMSRDTRSLYQPLAVSRDSPLDVCTDAKAHAVLTDPTLVAGVIVEDQFVRQYSQRRRLSHVVGAVNAQFVGSAGIEQRFDRVLRGQPGTVRGMKDAKGRELRDKRIISVPPVPGSDVYLTVDCNVQCEAETALEEGIAEYGADSGWCIVMNAKTGAILAMASLPDYDPHCLRSASPRETRNRAIAFTYEPGSVMKVITAAAAFDSGRATPQSRFSTDRREEGYYKLPGDGSHVWNPTMTVRDGIVHSSNIVIGKLGWQLGPRLLWEYLDAFGFGRRTGIELPGEETGILPNWRKWDRASWSRAPIGQYVSVTAIQMASAYQAIANDGRRMRPYIVDRIVDASGTVRRTQPELVGQPVSPTTARTVRSVMLGVAMPDGTARRAAIRGYTIAGKTGTAQKSAGRKGYRPGLYRASFCGIVPATEPELVILVTLDFEAKVKYHQGGNSAAPVWRRVAMGALRYLLIQPDRPEELEGAYDEFEEYDRAMDERALGNEPDPSDD